MLLVHARDLASWADDRDAPAEFPRLIRKLISASVELDEISFPAGESIDAPGWDGRVVAKTANAWVPVGRSYWEVSTQKEVRRKAEQDFKKREACAESDATYIFVTPRKWRNKRSWVEEKRKASLWQDVRCYDADDLEQWLEECPAVALEFAERLGFSGPGVMSAQEAWEQWSAQSRPPITVEAMLAGRGAVGQELIKRIKESSTARDFVALRADSAEEAVAFVIATLEQHKEDFLRTRAVVVTEKDGWRFVKQNPNIGLAIAARPEVAVNVPRREGLTAIIPIAAGDPQRHYPGRAGAMEEQTLKLDRPDTNAFEKALVGLGIESGEAERLARNAGRSWSVLRRRLATNPAIRQPEWLETSAATVLSVLCLLGAWDDSRDADKAIVSEIAGRPYEEVERDLRTLSGMLDASVLQLGSVWKAKAPLELFDIWRHRLTEAEIGRFFKIAECLLSAKDPVLDLAPDQRWCASLYGKQRPESGILRESLCDSLAKMAALGAEQFAPRAERLVHELLWEADRERWLSLADHLPSLAEAAPETFLQCVERSLSRSDCPIRGLFEDTDDAGSFGCCYHSNLLWALEILAWAPDRLGRVALILAGMSDFPTGSWVNTPLSSLVNLFRSWMPQTAASLDERLVALDILTHEYPDVAFRVLDGLVYDGPDTMVPSVRPKWRNDDAGAGASVPQSEARCMYITALHRLFALAGGNADRLCTLIGKWKAACALGCAENLLSHLQSFAASSNDENDRAKVCRAIRESLYYAEKVKSKIAGSEQFLDKLARIIDDLMPPDLVLRHKWLFNEYYPHIVGMSATDDWKERERQILAARRAALQEIWRQEGWRGLERLIQSCSKPGLVGQAFASLGLSMDGIRAWLCERIGEADGLAPISLFVRGLLGSSDNELVSRLREDVYKTAKEESWCPHRIVRAFDLFPPGPEVWEVVARFGKSVEHAYWSGSRYVEYVRTDRAHIENAAQKLLEAHRPWTALRLVSYHADPDATPVNLLFHILTGIAAGWELETEGRNNIDPDLLAEQIDRLEKFANVGRQDLAILEFKLFPILGYHYGEKAKSLFMEAMNEPSFFIDLLKLICRGDKKEHDSEMDERNEAAAKVAWDVLRSCKVVPGLTEDGRVRRDRLQRFVNEARQLAQGCGRLVVCDVTLGRIFAWAPEGEDGIWPCEPIRELLDCPKMEHMRRGLRTGLSNKRGVFSKSVGEGGEQERELAQQYRAMAKCLRKKGYIYLAADLDELAAGYECEAQQEDQGAQKRREGFL